MNRKTIAVDIDDVLAHHYDILTAYLNKKHGVNLIPEDMRSGLLSSPRINPVDHTAIVNSVEEYITSSEFYGPPIQDAIEVIEKLREKYRLIIITARPLSIEQPTIKWLTDYFDEAFEEIDFVGAARWGRGVTAAKDHLFEKYNVSVLIDDTLTHCTAAALAGIDVLLFGEYSWNKSEKQLPDSITRVRNWQEVAKYFNVTS